jgi:alpha-N-arabinofuranosidase
LDADLRRHSENAAFVSITELGALWFGTGPEREESVAFMPQFSATMTHALYMASQWIRYAQMDIGWVMGNDLAAPGLRGVLGGVNTGFVYGAEAMTREALKPVFSYGGRLVETRVFGQEHLTAPDGSHWQVLMVGAARASRGVQHVVVVNRHPDDEKSALLVPAGFPHDKIIDVATVHAAAITSFNDDGTFGGDNTVELTRSTLHTDGQGAFRYEFPPASITVMTLQPR